MMHGSTVTYNVLWRQVLQLVNGYHFCMSRCIQRSIDYVERGFSALYHALQHNQLGLSKHPWPFLPSPRPLSSISPPYWLAHTDWHAFLISSTTVPLCHSWVCGECCCVIKNELSLSSLLHEKGSSNDPILQCRDDIVKSLNNSSGWSWSNNLRQQSLMRRFHISFFYEMQ